jgi:Helix-turn-helix domain
MANAELTTADVAARLGRPERTVRLWCKQGRFDGAHAVSTPRGDYWMIPEGALKNFHEPERGRPTSKPKSNGASRSKKKGGKK